MEWVGGLGPGPGMAIPMVYWGTDCGICPLIIRIKFSLGVNFTAINFSSLKQKIKRVKSATKIGAGTESEE
jgi:hypothetical protein